MYYECMQCFSYGVTVKDTHLDLDRRPPWQMMLQRRADRIIQLIPSFTVGKHLRQDKSCKFYHRWNTYTHMQTHTLPNFINCYCTHNILYRTDESAGQCEMEIQHWTASQANKYNSLVHKLLRKRLDQTIITYQ